MSDLSKAVGFDPQGLPSFAPEGASPWGSYGYNIGGVGSTLGPAGRMESLVKNSSNLIALGDAYLVSQTQHVVFGGTEIGINRLVLKEVPQDYGEEFAGRRHAGLLNVLFADGHIESIGWRKLLLDRSDDALRKWNIDNQPHRDLLK